MPPQKPRKKRAAPLPRQKPFVLALVGLGVVGGAVARLLAKNKKQLAARCGRSIEVKFGVARRPKKKRDLPRGLPVVADWRRTIDDPEIDCVVELVGGENEARDCLMAAAAAGKHIITANKALLAKDGDAVFGAAKKRGVAVGFEAAVAGCIPAVKTLGEALAGDNVREVMGIINGTSNYILSRMSEQGDDFDAAFARARALGFAEADPSLDMDGWDSAHKIALIARLAFGKSVKFADLPVAGARHITPADLRHAAAFGYEIKLLARAALQKDGALSIGVSPALLPKQHPLAQVRGAQNAVLVNSAHAGDTAYYGAGAGGDPTAVAVAADIADIARLGAGGGANLNAAPRARMVPAAQWSSPHYLRLCVYDRPGALANITRTLAKHKVSIEAAMQPESAAGEAVDIALILHEAPRARINACLPALRALPALAGDVVTLPLVARKESAAKAKKKK